VDSRFLENFCTSNLLYVLWGEKMLIECQKPWQRTVRSIIMINSKWSVHYLQLPQVSCLLTAWSKVLLEKLTSFQVIKKSPSFYGTWTFITTFTSAYHLSLSWARSIQSVPPHPASWRSILTLFSHLPLGLPSGLFPSGFPTKTLYTPLLSPIRATFSCQFHPRFYHLNNTGWGVHVSKLLIM